MKVRAKLVVQEKGQSQYRQNEELHTVKLSAVYSNDPESENYQFWAATPVGEFKLGSLKKDIGEFFELGKEYYIDITPVE